MQYVAKDIECKWQTAWRDSGYSEPKDDYSLPKKYILNLTKIIKDGFNKIIFHKIAEKINIFTRRKRNKQSL